MAKIHRNLRFQHAFIVNSRLLFGAEREDVQICIKLKPMLIWRKPQEGEYLPYQKAYIDRVPEGDLMDILQSGMHDLIQLFSGLQQAQLTYRYAEDKWTVQEVLQHIIDTERIMQYRALRFARKDNTPLPGFEENDYVKNAGTERRSINEMLTEFEYVRRSGISMFSSFSQEALARAGTANNGTVTANAIAYVIAGHALHHIHILYERYGL